MAKLEATYPTSSRVFTTEIYEFGHGSTLLGAEQGLASRTSLVDANDFVHIKVSSNLIDILTEDGSKFYASGVFDTSFETKSFTEFISQVSGVIHQIVEIQTDIHPSIPRYTLSDVAIPVKNYFSLTTWADVLKGGDTVIGGPGGDNLVVFGGNATFKGMGGNDGLLAMLNSGNMAIYQGSFDQYQISLSNSISIGDYLGLTGVVIQDTVSDRDGRDMAVNIDRLKFSDINLALDTGKGEIAGSAYRLYKAAFDRLPEAEGLGFWINSLDHGADLVNVAQGFINSDEFRVMYGANPTDQQFVTLLYNHVLHRPPEGEGYQFWLNSLSQGVSRAQVLKDFSESGENITQTAELIANGIRYDEWQG